MNNEIAVADSGAVATRGAARSALALRPDQTEWTPMQLAALRQLGIEDAPEGDLQVFHHVCQRTGLDPFRKQIYMIGRKTKVKRYDERQRKQVDDWVMKYTIQTGIDGFRRNGREAAKREGEVVRSDGPYWQGADGGGWQDVWLDAKNPPAAAKFVIFRGGEPHVGIAMYSEFVQTGTYEGKTTPNSMWSKMPANQLAKCAEAQAWRRAYPDDFAGLQLEDAVQVIDPDGSPVERVRATSQRVNAADILAEDVPATTADATRAAAEKFAAKHDGTPYPHARRAQGDGTAPSEDVYAGATRVKAAADAAAERARRAQALESSAKPENAEADATATDPPMTKIQQKKIGRLMSERGITSDAAILAEIGTFLGREVAAPADVTRGEAIRLLDHLESDPPASQKGEKPDTPQVDDAAKASPVAEKWERARVLLDQLGADTDEKQLMFPRNFLDRPDLADPLTLTEADMDAVLAELEQLHAEERAGRLPIGTEGGDR